jgi:hypothetical protein
MQPIYSQIDPMRLGEVQRAMMIAYHYGERLAKGNLKEDSLAVLVSGYPSHGSVIDRDEARNLFKSVRPPTKDEGKIYEYLRPDVQAVTESDDEPLIRPITSAPPPKPKRIVTGGKNAQSANKTQTGSATRERHRGAAAPIGEPKSTQPAGAPARGRVQVTPNGKAEKYASPSDGSPARKVRA